MAQLNPTSSTLPVFPFHHVTKVQLQGKVQPSVEEGALPQLEVHYKTETKIPALKLPSVLEALQKYLTYTETFFIKGSIIDVLG